MALFPATPDNLNLLASKGLWFESGVTLDLPLHFAPPVRLFRCELYDQSRVDAFSFIGMNTFLIAVHIGRYCSIGDGVMILAHHPTDRISTHPFTYENIFGQPFQTPTEKLVPFENKVLTTTIGHDVWIGSGVRIKSGVTIGNGCIIGAGSVVTKNIQDYSIVGGVPAKLIRKRFNEETIKRLSALQWWQYNLIGMNLSWDNIQSTLNQLEDMVAAGKLSAYQPQWLELRNQ